MKYFIKTSLLSVLLAVPSISSASVIFTNFGAGLSYDTTNGNPVGNAFDGSNYAEGSSFTPGSTAQLSAIKVALSCFAVAGPATGLCPSNFTVALAHDSSDSPGSTIETFTVAGSLLADFGLNNTPITLTSILNPTLTLGTQYWLIISATIADSVVWNINTTGDVSDTAISSDGAATWFSPSGQTPGAYEIDATTSTAPEPGTMLLLAGGGVFVFWKRRARA